MVKNIFSKVTPFHSSPGDGPYRTPEDKAELPPAKMPREHIVLKIGDLRVGESILIRTEDIHVRSDGSTYAWNHHFHRRVKLEYPNDIKTEIVPEEDKAIITKTADGLILRIPVTATFRPVDHSRDLNDRYIPITQIITCEPLKE